MSNIAVGCLAFCCASCQNIGALLHLLVILHISDVFNAILSHSSYVLVCFCFFVAFGLFVFFITGSGQEYA